MTKQDERHRQNRSCHGDAYGQRNRLFSVICASTVLLCGCEIPASGPTTLPTLPLSDVVPNRNPSFVIGIVPDRTPPVRIGEKLGFMLSSDAQSYGHLYLLTASGSVVALAENLPLKAGKRIVFPPAKAEYALRARPPAGQERVLFLATRQPFVGFAGGAAKDGPVQIPVRPSDFIQQIKKATRALPEGGWVITEQRFDIIAS